MDNPILNKIISNEYLNINIISPINTSLPSNKNFSTPTTPINPTPINPTLPTYNDGKSIFVVFHMFISILAFYLALRCNAKINYTSIIIALFLPYPYVIYSIIMYNGICKIEV